MQSSLRTRVGLAAGRAHLLRSAQQDVVHRVEIQAVGDGGVVAVLLDRDGDRALAEALAAGDDALGQGLKRLVEGVPLAPLDRVAVVGGQKLGLAQLGEDQTGPGVFQQLGVVVGLHGAAHGAGGGDGGRVKGVDLAGGGVDGHVHVLSPFINPLF